MSKIILNQAEPSANLSMKIMNSVINYDRRRNRIRLITHSILSLVTFIALIPAVRYLLINLSESGFYSYFSLLISDSKYALIYFGDFIMSLTNSWPILASIIVLLITIALINSIRKIIIYSKFIITNDQPISL